MRLKAPFSALVLMCLFLPSVPGEIPVDLTLRVGFW